MSNIVVFDIGHGNDTFPPSKGLYLPDGSAFHEHQFNSDVVIKAKELAEFNGFEVLLPQLPHSPDIRLQDRTDVINEIHRKRNTLCLLSFHANAGSDKTSKGYGVFHWHSSNNGKVLAQIWDRYAGEILPNKRWGTGIWQSKLNHWTNFHMLRATLMPSILLEHFFFTNPDELKVFNTPEIIQKCAEVSVRTICEYAGKTYLSPTPPIPDEASDYAKESWKKAFDKKILDGTNPKQPLTREQFATVLDRLKLL